MKFFYKVGEKTFHNKLQAILQNQKSHYPIELITPYHDQDFSIEPALTPILMAQLLSFAALRTS